jgi:hypothetical protein
MARHDDDPRDRPRDPAPDARDRDSGGRWRSSDRARGGAADDRDRRADERRRPRDDDAAPYRGHAPARQDDRRYLVDRTPDEDRWYGRDLDEELDHRIDRGFSRDADERHDERSLLERGGSGHSLRDVRPRWDQLSQQE